MRERVCAAWGDWDWLEVDLTCKTVVIADRYTEGMFS